MLTTRDILSAAAGATVTLTVLAGTASWTPDGVANATALTAGDTLTAHADGRSTTERSRPAQSPPTDVGASLTLAEENVRLQEEVEALTFEIQALKGQLTAHGGMTAEWPADLPAAFEPEAFTAWAEDALADLPGLALAEVDCSEFPCLMLIQPTEDAPILTSGVIDWNHYAADFQSLVPPDAGTNISSSIAVHASGSDDPGVIIASVMPEDYAGQDISERLEVRSRDAVARLAEEYADE